MDFLKTLLAYVALTVAFSVQEGPLPQDVPTPTPLPPNVTASPIPNAPAATDVPTATPTASPIPEPTITPNMGYRTVQWQDRGSGVLKVQKKLIELGYLAEGEDDGAYGSKTTAAVRRFQKANGLSVDGIAGQATQTRLFEDPNVVPYSPPTVPVLVVPGPSAVISALAVSGLPTGRFTFEGFLSVNKKSRKDHLESVKNEVRTMVFYEAPHKLPYTLRDMAEVFGDRRIALVREITKIHEECVRTTLYKAAEYYEQNAPKGEFVLVIEGAKAEEQKEMTLEDAVEAAKKAMENGSSASDAAKEAAKLSGFKKGEIYKALMN